MVRCGSRWRSDQSGKYTCPWAAGFNYSISSLSGSSLVLHALPLHGQKVPAPGNVTLDCYGWRAVCLMAVVTAVTVAGRSPPGGGDGGPRDKCGALGIKGDNSRGSGCATWEFHLPGPLLHPGGTWTKVGSRDPPPGVLVDLALDRARHSFMFIFQRNRCDPSGLRTLVLGLDFLIVTVHLGEKYDPYLSLITHRSDVITGGDKAASSWLPMNLRPERWSCWTVTLTVNTTRQLRERSESTKLLIHIPSPASLARWTRRSRRRRRGPRVCTRLLRMELAWVPGLRESHAKLSLSLSSPKQSS